MSEPNLDAVIAKLTYMTHGRIGVDWRTGKPFSIHDKGNDFEALCEATEALRSARISLMTAPPAPKAAQIAALQCDLRLAISARDYANDMLDKERARIEALRRELIAARDELNAWCEEESGESYNNPSLNAALEMSGGVK